MDFGIIHSGKEKSGLKMVYAGSGDKDIKRQGQLLIVIADLIQFLPIKEGFVNDNDNSVVYGRVEL